MLLLSTSHLCILALRILVNQSDLLVDIGRVSFAVIGVVI